MVRVERGVESQHGLQQVVVAPDQLVAGGDVLDAAVAAVDQGAVAVNMALGERRDGVGGRRPLVVACQRGELTSAAAAMAVAEVSRTVSGTAGSSKSQKHTRSSGDVREVPVGDAGPRCP